MGKNISWHVTSLLICPFEHLSINTRFVVVNTTGALQLSNLKKVAFSQQNLGINQQLSQSKANFDGTLVIYLKQKVRGHLLKRKCLLQKIQQMPSYSISHAQALIIRSGLTLFSTSIPFIMFCVVWIIQSPANVQYCTKSESVFLIQSVHLEIQEN